MSANSTSPKEALRVVQESFLWVMQVKNEKTGVWQEVGKPIKGKTRAYALLNEQKANTDGRFEYRVIPKNEADKYKEGLNTGRSEKPRRRPLLALPENL